MERDDTTEGRTDLRLTGTLSLADAAAIWDALGRALPPETTRPVQVDLGAVEAIDGSAMALLVQAGQDRKAQGGSCDFVGAKGSVAKVLALYARDGDGPTSPRLHPGFLGRVGNATVAVLGEAKVFFEFLGGVVASAFAVLRRPSTGNWRDLPTMVARVGADAVPIVLLITFLIGFVMAFQSAVQLKQFGANIYVADLVGLSITRELGPLMTAIIVCGRSGAAFAAELGTMKVSEEVDALRTIGLGPIRYLVFPRLFAIVLALPILTLFGDLVGIVGGLLVGVVSLDLTVTAYMNQTIRALDLWDIGQGLVKAGVFGLAIGLISCGQGLATTGGAEGVGRRTTTSVVTSLFALILIDAVFTLTFHELGL